MALNKLTADALVDGTLDADAIGPASITTAKLHSNIISGQTAIGSVDASNDLLLIYDNDATSLKKVPVSSVGATNTDGLTEGSSNLYFTNARADARAQLKIDALVDSAPGTLDTLNELAAALGDDANFSTTVTNSIATKLPLAGGTLTGDVTFNGDSYNALWDKSQNSLMFDDGAKATFGTTSGDLQLFHNGVTSFIDNYTGNLLIRNGANDMDVTIQSDDGSGGLANYFQADGSTGSANLFNYGSIKLYTTSSGVAVTGTLVADGIDLGDNERLRIGASPTSDLQIWHDGGNSMIVNGTGQLIIADTNGVVKIQGKYGEQSIVANNDGSVELYHDNVKKFETTSAGVTVTGNILTTNIYGANDGNTGIQFEGSDVLTFHSGGQENIQLTSNAIVFNQDSIDMDFRVESNDVSAMFFVDAGNNTVGIGTDNPGETLVVHGDGARITVESADYEVAMLGRRGSSGSALDSGYLRLRKVGVTTTGVVIDTDGNSWFNGGNVGIGTSNPIGDLSIVDSATGTGMEIQAELATDTNRITNFNRNTSAYKKFRLDASEHNFYISGQNKVIIDSSGRLLVGKLSTNYASEGVEIRPNEILITKAGANPLSVRNNGVGGIISFNSAGTSVGNIGIESSGFYVDGEGSHAGLKLYASAIGPRQNGADIDATVDLGWASGRFKDIYASGTVYATPGGNDGSSANYAAKSANEILNNYGYKPSGLYWIREPNTGTPKQIYCDMETDGGGWMLWLEYNTNTNSMHNQSTARSNLGRSYMNNYSKYEVMVDASYVNQINRRSLRGVWELDANGAIRTTGFRNWGEVRIPETVGDPFDPAVDAYFNNGSNSEWIQRHQYYAINGASGWSSIGTGSQYVYIREPNPAVKPGTLRSYNGINYEWAYDGTQYGWWIHESSYAVPMFNSLTKNAGFAVTYANGRRDVFEPNNSTGQNSYVNVNNGNNGPGVVGVGSGVLVGEFSIMFNLGYSWGWSEMYIADAVSVNKSLAGHGSPYAMKDQFGVSNNSSNNQSYYNWKTSDQVTQITQSGLTPYSFGNYWTWNRQANGSVYLRNPGGTVYTLGTFFGPMKFFSGAQSPHSAQILNVQSAGRNSTLNASNEQAQTYLRH